MTEAPGAARSPAVEVWRRLLRHRPAMASLGVLVAIGVACAAAPLLTPYHFAAIDLNAIRQAPSWQHLMGTDDLGRDVFTRVLYGGRVSMLVGLLSALVATVLGTLVGAVAGYYGGRIDSLLMRGTDVAYALPALPLLIILASYTQAGATSIAIIIGVLSWMGTARVVRGEVLSLRTTPFVEAARALGASPRRVIGRHILPNTVGPIVVGATLAVGNAIIAESSLSFLGLGIQPPVPTWGNLLEGAMSSMAAYPWLTIFPGLAILAVVLAVNFLGDGLQDALDPTGPADRPAPVDPLVPAGATGEVQ